MTMMLRFVNTRKYGDDESYVMWGLTEDGLLPEFEGYCDDTLRDCFRAEQHSEGEDCEYCQVFVNDDFVITDGQVLKAPSGKRYRIKIVED